MATTYRWAIKTTSKVDQAAKMLRVYCVLNDLSLSDTSIMVCAYIMVYGYNEHVVEDILKAGVLGKVSSLKNEVYVLKRIGMLEGSGDRTKVATKITQMQDQALTPQTLMIINLDNR